MGRAVSSQLCWCEQKWAVLGNEQVVLWGEQCSGQLAIGDQKVVWCEQKWAVMGNEQFEFWGVQLGMLVWAEWAVMGNEQFKWGEQSGMLVWAVPGCYCHCPPGHLVWMGRGDHPKTFLLKALCCQSTPSWLKVVGWSSRVCWCEQSGMLVAHVLVSAQVLLVLTLGLWTLGLRTRARK